MKNLIGSSIIIVLTLLACDKKETRVDFENDLKGVWKQTAYDTSAVTYSITTITFDCSTFMMETKHQTDVVVPEDSCSTPTWKDVVGGNYFLTGESVFMEGYYKDKQGNDKLSGCHKIGYYNQTFIGRIFKDRLTLSNDMQTIPLIKVSGVDC